METKDIMSKFDELYGIMASSANVKYMHVFGDTIRKQDV
jgi:predicted nucleotidyltransferase